SPRSLSRSAPASRSGPGHATLRALESLRQATVMRYLLVFAASYVLNIVYMTVFYHRGFTHGAFTMGPRLRRLVAATGSWVTGLDPKAWACMHRLHHLHSD